MASALVASPPAAAQRLGVHRLCEVVKQQKEQAPKEDQGHHSQEDEAADEEGVHDLQGAEKPRVMVLVHLWAHAVAWKKRFAAKGRQPSPIQSSPSENGEEKKRLRKECARPAGHDIHLPAHWDAPVLCVAPLAMFYTAWPGAAAGSLLQATPCFPAALFTLYLAS